MASGDPLYLSINAKPRAIVQSMDELVQRHQENKKRYDRTRWFPLLLFFAGLPCIAIDMLANYSVCLFTTAAVVLWVAAIFLGILRWRARRNPTFPPAYSTTREVIDTLRDDLSPKQNMLGYLDLTGAEKPSKLARTGKGMHKETVKFYRDNWLNLKLKLYDGNVMRLKAIDRTKAHDGRWKRGRSGKLKWKGGKIQHEQELDIRLTVNPEVYTIQMPHQRAFPKIGQYTVSELTNDNGIINLTATTFAVKIEPSEVLGTLRFVYNLLERKDQK
jgi:hypothetical protein